MDALEHPSRLELEKAWHSRVGRAFGQYRKTFECVKETIDEWRVVERGPNPDGVLAIQLARREESLALHEYMRGLRLYRELVIRRLTPDEAPDKDLL